jgi:hypothetical protein
MTEKKTTSTKSCSKCSRNIFWNLSAYLPNKILQRYCYTNLGFNVWHIRSTFSLPLFGGFGLLNWAVSNGVTYLRPRNQKVAEEACTSTALLDVLGSQFEIHPNCEEILPVFNTYKEKLLLYQLRGKHIGGASMQRLLSH